MERTRVTLEVSVDLDPVPGAFHTKESALIWITEILRDRDPQGPNSALQPRSKNRHQVKSGPLTRALSFRCSSIPMVEKTGLNPVQCGFESHLEHHILLKGEK